ncbi:hypothetical protein [Micromonospora sp. CMU55-4]|uniref:nSTAND3 domain-containing NTPase n=1 Tax=Micromonospora sp. CMU55-4 TaxID=2717028 RepID=UPI001408E557|nr:hypothetical protein [Micromonospora sp. CMU55-4]NHO82133.1 hypothetical protein [Micromonospora sp. CMU55-4]
MGLLDYDLHKLGWRAFQDLCAVILQQVLGQTFHTFADSNDAGRDGAFYGHWATEATHGLSGLGPSVATVAQCKFSVQASGTLTPSMLRDEVAKVRRLHARRLCDAYLLLTNLAVTGQTEAWLKEQLRTHGVQQCLVLDGKWICQQISQRPDLRRYVPRVYGLGDLGKILDDRRLRQARALLSRLEADLATFVPTEAYRRAAAAVADHGFVLLLGEPACGKSTIAATLAMAALDNWGCGVRRVDSADELVATWDPDEQRQLFWVDDAFGGIRHDAALTDGWSRRMDQVMTTVGQGARVILTSRDYIYRDARPYLKEYAYPRLREHKVVIDVTDLTTAEKRQILYNHLRAGDQPRQVLEHWRPYLRHAASVARFQPEVARRLAWRAFTRGARLATEDDLVRYFERPVAFLSDVLRQLEPGARAALACVYLSGDELAAPVHFTPALAEAVLRLGVTEHDVLRAFPTLDTTFLQQAVDTHGDPVWRFRHPTIREGFAAVTAEDVNAVSVFLDGLEGDELLQQVDCGGATARGTLVRVPASLYKRVIPRVSIPTDTTHSFTNPFAEFLLSRCSPTFLRGWAVEHEQSLDRLTLFGGYIDAHWEPRVLGRMQEAGALPEAVRRKAVERLQELALHGLDSGWLNEPVCRLFTPTEREDLLELIRDEILPNLEYEIDISGEGYSDDIEPEYRYREAKEAIDAYRQEFANDLQIVAMLDGAEQYVAERIEMAASDYEPPQESPRLAERSVLGFTLPDGRDEFEDVAEGK